MNFKYTINSNFKQQQRINLYISKKGNIQIQLKNSSINHLISTFYIIMPVFFNQIHDIVYCIY